MTEKQSPSEGCSNNAVSSRTTKNDIVVSTDTTLHANNTFKPNFPFTAVVAQASYKMALTLVAINPAIGGVLVCGPRGSAKSTLARGLADVMPHADGIKHNFVTLPLGATEEMLTGTLNLQQVLDNKKVQFQAGLLAKADDGILYVDEVNLLADQLVDLLLDVASSGVNIVERDGISHSHTSQFILLGTMNPDEGELRPQLQDRFGLAVELNTFHDIDERIQIVSLREQFDAAPELFIQQYANEQRALTQNIENARVLLPEVDCPLELRRVIAQRCYEANVDGMRADIVWLRSAMAHAALFKRRNVVLDDILAVEELVLNHRRKQRDDNTPNNHPSSAQKPFSRPPQSTIQPPQKKSAQLNAGEHKSNNGANGNQGQSDDIQGDGDWGAMAPQLQKVGSAVSLNLSDNNAPSVNHNKNHDRHHNVAAHIFSSQKKGRMEGGPYHAKCRNNKASKKIHWFSSLLINAGQWPLKKLQFKPQKTGQDVIHLILLDTSASTIQQQLFSKAKAVILSIAQRAYLAREQLAIFGFGNQKIDVLLAKRRAPQKLKTLLDNIPAMGGTPLREALQHALVFQQRQYQHAPNVQLRTYIITDGKTTQRFDDVRLMGKTTLVDIEQSAVKRGKGENIAHALNAYYVPLTC